MQDIDKLKDIPQELRKLDNWVLWKLEDRKGKKTKIPYQINGNMAKSTVKETWTCFDNVLRAYKGYKDKYNGIGFVFTKEDSITGIDIDHCIENGVINEKAQSIINYCNSYTEKSQSGSGVHILVKGFIPKAVHKDIEIYSEGRYFVITGDKIQGESIEPRQNILDSFHKKYNDSDKKSGVKTGFKVELNIRELLDKAFNSKNGSKIKALYNGDISDYNNDHSSADQALCNYLAFWLDKDFSNIDQAFRSSGLYRDKWNEMHGSRTYGAMTINKAINSCNETYQEFKTNETYQGAAAPAESFIYTNDKGKRCVNTGLLAGYIRDNYHYIIVRKQGFDNDFLYWYENGYYKRMSANEFKGKIKQFIPIEIRKPNQWEESYKELITDRASIRFDDLNRNSKYINLKNGLYNIETGCLEEHTPLIKNTIQLNCSFKKNAAYPTEWMNFVKMFSNNDKNIMNIIQEWFGLTLSNIKGSITKKCLALWGIRGNTGKTQFNNMLIYLIGDENICSTPIQDFSKTFGTGDIYGAKAIIIDDQKATNIEDSSTFKSITGGGYIRCEIKGKQAFPYEFNGTLTFGCNDLPYFKGDKGDHLFERFLIIPCDNVIPEGKRLGNILEKFKPEADGIFLWAMEGLRRLIDNKYKFTQSDICVQALEDYKCANDSLYNFIIEKYIITGDRRDRIKKTLFENDYISWCEINDKQALERKNIPERALKHGITKIKSCGDNYYQGITKKGTQISLLQNSRL